MGEVSLVSLSEKAEAGNDLEHSETMIAADLLASPEPPTDDKERLLVALADKGETPSEIAAFASRFRELARDPGLGELAESAIDVCGTGGDKSGSFNISTTVSFILSAAGIPVFKHGNRSITSKCGSADLLEAIGVRLEAEPELLRASLEELRFAFFFAPAYHPAFKEIVPVRKRLAEKGRRTVFNVLGPLINPGRPAHQLLGVFSPDFVSILSSCLEVLNLRSGLVVHGIPPEGGLDELCCSGSNRVSGVGALSDVQGEWIPEDFGLERHPNSELAGGDVTDNLHILEALLSGQAPAGLLATITLNAGAALWIVDRAENVKEGITIAKDLLLGGEVRSWINRAKAFYAEASDC
ncbi:MAG: anthranilate phosphoribosyltransferase [Opitutales bacterium]